MATTETIEGMIGPIWYHYDTRNDVLYLRRGVPTAAEGGTYGEESHDGLILHHADADDTLIAITVVGWWERFGQGALPDSLKELSRRIESTARTLPLAA